MNLLLVIATDEQGQLESALRGHLNHAFPGEVREVDATCRLPRATSEEDDVALARDLLEADAVIMLLPHVHERRSMHRMETWLQRAGVDGVTVMVEPEGITGLLDEKPVFLIRPMEKPVTVDADPIHSARSGLATLGLNDITVIDVDPSGRKSPFNISGDRSRLN